jgi:hypothetical protein
MIPNNLHYVHLGTNGRSWKLHHYLSVKSAYLRGGFNNITIWVDNEPDGDWWSLTKPMIEIQKIEPPTEIFGKEITQPAHKSDVIRLQILIEYGGVYVDTDTIFIKSFQPLLNNKFALGQQNINGSEGLCPAVILSEPDSEFGKRWLMGFKDSFGGGPPGSDTWCTHSVHYPSYLAKQIPNEITILNHEMFFWPLYHQSHIEMMFETNVNFPNAYSHHLWESSGKKYLDEMTLEKIKEENTTFTKIVKDLI